MTSGLQIYTVSQKTGPCFIRAQLWQTPSKSTILSLLQTKTNHDKVYHKIYHHTSNLLVHYLVKSTRMYLPTLLAWFPN